MGSISDPNQQPLAAVLPSGINLDDIQGDILLGGFPKRAEVYCFFKIEDAKLFASRLSKVHWTTASDILADRQRLPKPGFRSGDFLFPVVGQNIAFSFKGLSKLDQAKSGNLKASDIKNSAPAFANGMSSTQERNALDDPNWQDPKFSGPDCDGVIKVGGSDNDICEEALTSSLFALGFKEAKPVITVLGREVGLARTGANKGHEHFGFEDGISQPQVTGVDDQDALSDPDVKVTNTKDNFIPPGIILVGREGDSQKPAWMQDGSFLVFRKLQQDVKAWNDFVTNANNLTQAGLPGNSGKFAASLMGRWPSGCPINMNNNKDDTSLAFRNDFDFNSNDQCPASAHIRKSNIRQHFDTSRILRRGITYGTDFDKNKANDDKNRGLLFACYQSSIEDGYKFIQTSWANNKDFPRSNTGIDPVFGQKNNSPDIVVQKVKFKGINQFVQMKGGEYFFAPSVKAIREVLSV